MSRRMAQARPGNATEPSRGSHGDLLDAAIRKLQLIEAITRCTERSATHDFVEVNEVADVLVALVMMIEQALDLLDQCEVAASKKRGAP